MQLHGHEDDNYIQTLRQKLPVACQIWKALSIGDSIPYHDNSLVSRYIFDNGAGGTGKSFNWSLLRGKDLSNVILAGGINPQNVSEALATDVIGVDLNSGVEVSPGIKDKQKITAVFEQI